MDYDEAVVEQRRIAGLLEDNFDYRYLTTVQAIYDADGVVEGYYVGVGWYAVVDGKEYGNVLALSHSGMSVESVKRLVHRNYQSTMNRR
jgi:hypothetical protein